MPAVLTRIVAHSLLAALCAMGGLALAQSPRVQPAQPAGSPAVRPAPAPEPPSGPRTSRPVDRIVAVVNDEVITANELRSRAAISEMQLRRQKIQPPPRDVLERQVLERMIVDRAQLQLARETGVRVDDGTVNAAIARIAESNGLSVPALRQRIEADGLSFNQFRDDIRQDIILSRLREREVDNRIQISESELDNFVAEQAGVSADAQEVNLAQILLRVPENADSGRIDEIRKRAEDLLGQLRGGADFARLAASFSNAAEALQGG
jgi:peptidyl-prolyl cis-trans isomerase SurA